MENYIYELSKNNGIKKLEETIEKDYQQVKVSVFMKASQREMYIIIADRCFHFIKAYEASDFDCKSIEQCYLPFGLEKLPESVKTCDDAYMRRFYLRFMKKEFETYYDDYKAHQLELVDKDLDCNQSV